MNRISFFQALMQSRKGIGAVLLIGLLLLGCYSENPSTAQTRPSDKALTLQELAGILQVPYIIVPQMDKKPGHMEPDFSKWGGPLKFGYLSGTGKTPPVNTEGYLACDQEYVYLAIRCFGSDTEKLSTEKQSLDGNVWKGENVEAMFLPFFDTMHEYFQFAVDPAGSLYDAQVNKKSWNSGAKVRTFRNKTHWTVVLAVPYAGLGVDPKTVSTVWRVNLHRAIPRVRGKTPGHDLSWSPTHSTSNHVPFRFGLAFLKGLGRPFDAAGITAQQTAMDRFDFVYKQTFDKDTVPFDAGVLASSDSPGGKEYFLRFKGKRCLFLKQNFGQIQGMRMAYAYRCNPDQTAVVMQGVGTPVRDTRPGFSHVWGRGLKAAGCTAQSADGNVVVDKIGLGAYLYKRPYGH